MTAEDAKESLKAAATMAELGTAWNAIPVNLKQDANVLGLKEARKEELTPTK
jgi:hypothetical protein